MASKMKDIYRDRELLCDFLNRLKVDLKYLVILTYNYNPTIITHLKRELNEKICQEPNYPFQYMYDYTPEESCWLYWKYYQKESKGIYIRRFKNFDKHREDATKWVCFEKLSIVARDYKINLHEYIPMVAKKFKEL